MIEWWNSLELAQQIFALVGVGASVILVIQNASDAYGSGTVCGVTGRGYYLDSRCSTSQRAGDIGDGPCLDGFGIDHGSRSCEGTPGGSTVGDNDRLVDEFSVRMELNIDDSA